MLEKERAGRNRTVTLNDGEIENLKKGLVKLENIKETGILNKTLNGDLFSMIDYVPDEFADLIIIDPPYNLTKDFNGFKFKSRTQEKFDDYLESWFPKVCKKLKKNGSLYMCGDWRCTSSLQRVIEKAVSYTHLRAHET